MPNLLSLLPVLQMTVIISLAMTGGIALCLSLWVIPLLLHPENSSRTMIAQFDETIRRGEKYLMPGGQLQALALVTLGILTSQHPDSATAAGWRNYVFVGLGFVGVALHENYLIFPLNAKIRAMGKGFEGNRKSSSLPEEQQKELVANVLKWRRLHSVRIAWPVVAACVSLAAVL